jgi:uncharacterized protein YhfF
MDPAFDMDWHQLERFSFGDSPALADELAALVLADTKTATCWAASDGASTYVGKQMVVLSGAERPLAIIETVELTNGGSVKLTLPSAYDEGEGDRSLVYWRQAHRRYFTRQGQFAEDMLLYCERFRLVERIGEDSNADAQRRSSS